MGLKLSSIDSICFDFKIKNLVNNVVINAVIRIEFLLNVCVAYDVLLWKDVQTASDLFVSFFIFFIIVSFVTLTETCGGQCGGSDPDEDQLRQAGPYGSTL